MRNALVGMLMLLGVLVGSSPTATASTVTLEDVYNPADVFFSRTGLRSLEFTHDLTSDGFDPATDFVTNATLSLYFRDDSDPSAEMVDVSLDDLWDFNNEKITSGSGSTQFTFLVAALVDADGKLSVSLTRQNGTFYFERSVLTAEVVRDEVVTDSDGSESVAPVPEPGSVSLLALGVAGVIARKLRADRSRPRLGR